MSLLGGEHQKARIMRADVAIATLLGNGAVQLL